MLNQNGESLPIALRAVGSLGDITHLAKVAPYLKRPETPVRIAAMEALAALTDEAHVDAVRAHIQRAADGQSDTVIRAAARVTQTLDGNVAATGRFAATATDVSAQSRMASSGGHAASGVAASSSVESQQSTTLLLDDVDLDEVTQQAPAGKGLDIPKLEPGELIEGRYKFIRKIGKGAFGTVLLVEDTVVDDELILKFLNPNVASDEEMMKRFVHELRYSRKITHKNVIRIYDFLYIAGSYAISMEYFPSHTLGAEIANEKPMAMQKAVGYAIDMCTGMTIAHNQGIVHRDLKPANILIDDSGLLKIVDFGVAAAAKSGDTQLTKTGYVIGSPKYMAPEQILGKKVDERADIYSLGVILYEMLAGQPPYSTGDHMAVMYQHVQGKAEPLGELNPKLPKPLVDIVERAMQVDKNKRYKSMEEFKAHLETVRAEL